MVPSSSTIDCLNSDTLWSQMALLLIIFLSLIIVRPADLLRRGSQPSPATSSLFERLSFSAAAPILALGKEKGLNIQGLPALDVPSRSIHLTKQWNALPSE